MRRVLLSSLKFFFIFCVVAALFSPITALFLNKKLRDHTYSEFIFSIIAHEESRGCKTNEEKILKIFNYVAANSYPANKPYKGTPLDYLLYGGNWCDYQARILNSILGRLNIPCRYAMLVDVSGISPHTMNEIYIKKKWALFDTLKQVVFKANGEYLSAEDLLQNKENLNFIISELNTSREAKEYLSNILNRTIANQKQWRRSKPRVEQYHIVDILTGFYTKFFGKAFMRMYQNFYLKKELANFSDDKKLFLKARHYQLSYRFKESKECYRKLINEYPNSNFRNKALGLMKGIIN